MQTMSPPRLASSSVRRNIIRIKIKKAEKKTELMEAGAVLTSTKEELHPNSSPDMKLHQSTSCSSQRKGEKPLSTLLYLEAVLKFLQVASLWEHEQGENNEAAVRLYSDTAMLCQYCASECEQEKNMPAAAIAYKALELIHMRHAFLISPALATNEAVSLGDAMTAAFEATMRYQILMQGKELAAPIRDCLNFHFNNVNVFIEMAHRAFESIF